MKLSIKKGHIVLGALVLALGAAVYLNWDYMKQTDYVAAGNTNQTTNDNEGTANYGDAYFVSARLSRTQSRDEAMDALKYMLEDSAMEEGQLLYWHSKRSHWPRPSRPRARSRTLLRPRVLRNAWFTWMKIR